MTDLQTKVQSDTRTKDINTGHISLAMRYGKAMMKEKPRKSTPENVCVRVYTV
jgi:hypothetical protein